MFRKMIYLVSFVLVLGLALTSAVKAADPSLVGCWRFDEGSGTTAYDSSGNGNDGTLLGDPQWVTGKMGGALSFDGVDDYVDAPSLDNTNFPQTTGTITLWVKGDFASQDEGNILDGWSHAGNHIFIRCKLAGTNRVQVYAQHPVDDYIAGGNLTDVLENNQWNHLAITYDTTTDSFKVYANGAIKEDDTMTNTDWVPDGQDVRFGNGFNGLIDEVALFDVALEAEDIEAIMNNGLEGIVPDQPFAIRPSPANGQTYVPRDVVLSWEPGDYAAPTNGHKVYFSDIFNDVNDGIGGIAQDANSYTPPQRLDFSTTYYWRVDEVNAPPDSTVFKGSVWSFTTEPVAYAIENIIATASSIGQADMGPENTINGSGLDVSDLHSVESTDMWLSGSEPNATWIEYEFDKVHKLHEMWVWNSNQTMESILGLGCKDVTIEYSVDGNDYTTLGTVHEFAQGTGAADYAHNTTVDFGSAAAKYIRLTANSNWGGLLDQYGLSEVRFFYIPVYAREPSPDSGATDVELEPTLGFRAGREAAMHDVYFSSDEQAVADSNAPVATVNEASYGPLSLDLGKTYYWRIDEVNEAETPTTWQGDIWNFATQEYFVVDDFEDYDAGENQIWYTWKDGLGYGTQGTEPYYPGNGTGSAVGAESTPSYTEETIVHSGSQSMPLFYDNNKQGFFKYSEAEMTLSYPRDWTEKGINTLTIWFRGNPAGFVEEPAGTFAISASGADIWGTADEFRYVWKQLSGAGSISAQVLNVENTDAWAKAGVMIRETLDPGSKFAAVYITPGNGCRFQGRLTTGASATSDTSVATAEQMAIQAHYWVKLERDASGNFNGYYSSDGVSWQAMTWNPQRISMSPNVYIGLALTSHSAGVNCEAEFSNVQTTGTVSPPMWTQEAIGIVMASNDPEPMYVALNGSAVVYHDNPDAAQIAEWTEWTIDLQAFADQGVNLANVNTIALGLGDKKNPLAGGSGTMYFDDIRLYPLREPEADLTGN